jgi:Zn-dependent M28 family amino/carboxypeptidase
MPRTGFMRVVLSGLGILASIFVVSCEDAPSLESMLADVKKMEVDSNPGRREALMMMLDERGIRFELESFEVEETRRAPTTTGVNIVVTIGEGPSDIVIGAHFDAIRLRDGTLSRGAVDNAASAVILTRVAETLQSESLSHRIRIVFFDLEEIGLRGSQSYVEIHETDRIDAAINLDVNGYGDMLFFGPTSEERNTGLFELIAESCEDRAIGCRRFARYPNSDHLSFQRAGIPNVSFSILPADQAEELWIAENGTPEQRAALEGVPAVLALIHTPEDTSEHIDPAGMAITYRAVLDLVRKLDRLEP